MGTSAGGAAERSALGLIRTPPDGYPVKDLTFGCNPPGSSLDMIANKVRCPEKQSLVTEYDACVQHYAETARILARIRETASADQYHDALASVGSARDKTERFRKILNKHTHDHGCEPRPEQETDFAFQIVIPAHCRLFRTRSRKESANAAAQDRLPRRRLSES